MKIDHNFKTTSTPVSNRSSNRPGNSPQVGSPTVSLSPLAGSIQASEPPPVNSARIQEIKEAIAQGRFKINVDAIASGLIETARELVLTQRKA